MTPQVICRFVVIGAIATFALFTLWAVVGRFLQAPPGDYQVRQGDILLSDRKYDEALERFDAALRAAPNHRGAWMGRAIVFLQTARHDAAETEFTRLIDHLMATLAPDDATGRAVLAGAYANRGILYDRTERPEKALADYTQALKIDERAVGGPDLFDKILYGNAHPATVRDRAAYLQQQLALPESERRLKLPEIDDRQRMHKP